MVGLVESHTVRRLEHGGHFKASGQHKRNEKEFSEDDEKRNKETVSRPWPP